MIYANDQWIQLPVKDLYDTQMMLTSINVAKDLYEKGQQEIKDFKKEYGDFLSPIQKDMDWYDQNVTGKVRDVINNLYANGIDPLRSAEGRAAISRVIGDIDTGMVNKMRQSAEMKKLYDAAALKMGPKYNRNFADWDFARRNNGVRPEEWSTSQNGVFSDPTPVEYSNLQELVHPSFSTIKPHMLSKEEVESRGYKYDKNNDYTGIVRADMERVMDRLMPGVRDDSRFMYHRQLAKQDLINEGNEHPTEKEIDKRLVENAIIADSGIMTPLDISPNKFSLIRAEGNEQIRVAGAKEAIAFKYDKRRANELGEGGGGSKKGAPSIFREAAANFPQGPWAPRTRGASVGYTPFEDPHYQWMDPVGEGIREAKSGKGNFGYFIPRSALPYIYRSNTWNDDGTKTNAAYDTHGDAFFIPSGQIHAEKDGFGTMRYYITGTLTNGAGKNAKPIQDWGFGGGSRLYELEVTERAFNYAKQQQAVNAPSN